MKNKTDHHARKGYCPVYDMACPSGPEAAESCENRFTSEYNPLTNFRDAEIEHCALYRREQLEHEASQDED
ncbi:MAG: hypothetical protein K9M49_08540 [Candidatus Marinimicrobia bacterium]|nr:hypothetical protein [Candidatus Neomarinimicrobiota bacterium]MCF7850465.1 hypothetical protein [Candidatus Neomarinimicrobiota bacterium]MCF7905184.1 hypothetical protein [Candidatus Neomarinimicrobiota bacterium]